MITRKMKAHVVWIPPEKYAQNTQDLHQQVHSLPRQVTTFLGLEIMQSCCHYWCIGVGGC